MATLGASSRDIFRTSCLILHKSLSSTQAVQRLLSNKKIYFWRGQYPSALTISSKDFFFGGGNPVYALTWQRLVKTQTGRPKDAFWGHPQVDLLKWIEGLHGEGVGVENRFKTAVVKTCGAATDKHMDTHKGLPLRQCPLVTWYSSSWAVTIKQHLSDLNKTFSLVVIEGLQDT